MISGNADFDEAADEVAHVGIAAVAGIGVGDDEGPVVKHGSGVALLGGHTRTGEMLVAVGGQSARTMEAASSGTWLNG